LGQVISEEAPATGLFRFRPARILSHFPRENPYRIIKSIQTTITTWCLWCWGRPQLTREHARVDRGDFPWAHGLDDATGRQAQAMERCAGAPLRCFRPAPCL